MRAYRGHREGAMSHLIKSAMVFLAASLALAQASGQTKKSKATCDDARTQGEMNLAAERNTPRQMRI